MLRVLPGPHTCTQNLTQRPPPPPLPFVYPFHGVLCSSVSFRQSVDQSVFVCLSMLFVCFAVYMFDFLFVFPSVCLSFGLSVLSHCLRLFCFISISPSLSPPLPCLSLSVCLFLQCLSIYLLYSLPPCLHGGISEAPSNGVSVRYGYWRS